MPALNTKLVDLTGQVFERLTVLHDTRVPDKHRKNGRRGWVCECICGNVITLAHGQLQSGGTRSCGCLSRDTTATRNRSLAGIHRKEIRSKDFPEYGIWCDMKKRCDNPNYRQFDCYGGRGIKVCERWLHSFDNFYVDMGKRPSNNHTIERINNEGNYSPDNCKWLPKALQAQNKRNNHNLTYNGETLCISEWARRIHINVETLRRRLLNHYSIEEALTTPKRQRLAR